MAQRLKLRLSVSIAPAILYWGLVGACLMALPAELASENVTLSTYFPAPSGIYQKLLSTQDTWLGRDPGGYLDVGTQAAPGTTWWGAATKLAVMDPSGGSGGRVGINAWAPGDRLEIDEVKNAQGGLYITGATPGVQLAGGAGALLNVGGTILLGSNGKVLLQQGAGASALAVSGNNVGFANSSPVQPADVGGDIVIRGCLGGTVQSYAGILSSNFNRVSNCPGNTYATWAPGIMSNRQTQFVGFTTPAGSDGAIEGAGEMLCCPCPPGGCPNLP